MDPDPAVLKRQRAIIKGSCTRIKTYADSIASVTPSVAAQLEERKSKLSEYWSEYNSVQSQLELLDENEVNDRVNFEEAYYTLSARIREILNPVILPRAIAHSPSSSRASDRSEAPLNIRLPKLNLPTFSGKYHEWFPFFDSFNSIIHLNASITNIQKLQYLKASLSDDASNVISSLEISDLNYEVAWNLLRERYDNKRVIVHTHVKAIMELPSMTRENASELRQIADGVVRHVQALQALKRPTIYWDDLFVHVLSSKLDALTLREWQSSLVGTDPPTFKQFNDFINHRCQMLEATANRVNTDAKGVNKRSQSNPKHQAACVATVKPKCNFCNGEHAIYYCKNFLALPVSQRITEIHSRKICGNCLRSSSHSSSKCTSRGCKVCKVKHNTLLHQTNGSAELLGNNSDKPKEPGTTNSNSSTSLITNASSSMEQVMLSTAVINALNDDGATMSCRALLDSGSQANFITREYAKLLGLRSHSLNVSISGINEMATRSTQAVWVRLQSRLNSYTATIQCIVTEQITGKLPAFTMKREAYNLPRNLQLADPQFNISSRIDILIGAELFWELLCVGQVRHSSEHPMLQKTRFGWILTGRLIDSPRPTRNIQSFHTIISNAQLHDQLSRFWQVEDINDACELITEEAVCERHFLENVSQNSHGRYVVKLPIKESLITDLGDSKDIALKRLRSLERRFSRDPILKSQYVSFMAEYLTLGHMKEVNASPDEGTISFYLPHHCVFKHSGQSSKIRVVFDASCKDSSGASLNDMLRVGPVVQQDLMSIVLRFRTFRYVMVADIIKMYRQILLHPSQTCLQRILWRSDPHLDVKTYELTTVTYGTASASYLATRCLKHLAEQHSSEFPIGATHVQRDFYVDDLLTGADTIQDAKLIRDEIIQLLKLGFFELSKWASNCSQLLRSVDSQDGRGLISFHDEANSHVLGIQWNQVSDTFHFAYEPEANHGNVSKRTILSETSKLFDPLGLLGPALVIAKLILQDLWKTGAHWNESVPQAIHPLDNIQIAASGIKSTNNIPTCQI